MSQNIPCPIKRYFNNKVANLSQFGVVVGTLSEEGYIDLKFPYPFQFVGLVNTASVPVSGEAVFPNSRWILAGTSDQNGNQEMLQSIFIAMMYGNRDMDTALWPGIIEYSPHPMSGNYYQYFQQWMSSGDNGTMQYFYNDFISPLSEMMDFWQREETTPIPATLMDRLRQICLTIFEQSDRRLWGAPGIYRINANPDIEFYPATISVTEIIPE